MLSACGEKQAGSWHWWLSEFFPQSAPEGETRGGKGTHSERVLHLPIAIAQLIKF